MYKYIFRRHHAKSYQMIFLSLTTVSFKSTTNIYFEIEIIINIICTNIFSLFVQIHQFEFQNLIVITY